MRYVEEDNEIEYVVGEPTSVEEYTAALGFAKLRMRLTKGDAYYEVIAKWKSEEWKETVAGHCFWPGYQTFRKWKTGSGQSGDVCRLRLLGLGEPNFTEKVLTWRDKPAMF